MRTHTDKSKEDKGNSPGKRSQQESHKHGGSFQFVDNRPRLVVQRRIRQMGYSNPRLSQLKAIQEMAIHSTSQHPHPIQKNASPNPGRKENNTGLPDQLKSGIESLSGYSMDDVKVHYNSDKPAQLHAHAYAQGTDIHIASGQEKHLPHEAWHVVQQKQGRVTPSLQLQGGVNVNDDAGLEKEADHMGRKVSQLSRKEENPSAKTVLPNQQIIQLVAISPAEFPEQYLETYSPKYKVWRDNYLGNRKMVYDRYSISEVMIRMEAAATESVERTGYKDDLALVNTKFKAVSGYTDSDPENRDPGEIKAIRELLEAMNTFLAKWDPYGEKEQKEKRTLTELLVQTTTMDDLVKDDDLIGMLMEKQLFFDHRDQTHVKKEKYKAALKLKILNDPRLIATLYGQDENRLHIIDTDPEVVSKAIDEAVEKIRGDGKEKFDDRKTVTEKKYADSEWKDWRKNDCVFAAIIYVMNKDTEKYTSVIGDKPKSSQLSQEKAEHQEAQTIATKLGISQNIVPDPVLFSIMKRLKWPYIGGYTWTSFVEQQKYKGGQTYIISYATSKDANSNHTVVLKDGVVYDRQSYRLGKKDTTNVIPTHTNLPMEIWHVNDMTAASKILN